MDWFIYGYLALILILANVETFKKMAAHHKVKQLYRPGTRNRLPERIKSAKNREKVSIRVMPHLDIDTDAGIYWFMHNYKYREEIINNWHVNPGNIQTRLLSRFSADDLMAIASFADTTDYIVFKCGLFEAYDTMDELAEREEWRHI